MTENAVKTLGQFQVCGKRTRFENVRSSTRGDDRKGEPDLQRPRISSAPVHGLGAGIHRLAKSNGDRRGAALSRAERKSHKGSDRDVLDALWSILRFGGSYRCPPEAELNEGHISVGQGKELVWT